MTTHIGKHPLPEMYSEGLEIDCQCARCGSSCDSDRCNECEDGSVWDAWGYYDEGGPAYTCPACRGDYVTHRCLSSPEWCEANPQPGRESVKRGKIEWFTIPERKGDL